MLPNAGLVYGSAYDNAGFARFYAVSKSVEYFLKKEAEKNRENVQSIRIVIGTPSGDENVQDILSKLFLFLFGIKRVNKPMRWNKRWNKNRCSSLFGMEMCVCLSFRKNGKKPDEKLTSTYLLVISSSIKLIKR